MANATVIDKSYPGLVEKDGLYRFEGSIVVEGALTITLDSWLIVSGRIEAGLGIEAGRGIEAGLGIKAGEGIKAGGGIEAGLGIKAGEGIEAGLGIEAGRGIEAGLGIKAGEGIKASLSITCKKGLISGLRVFAGVCTWRETTPEENKITCASFAAKGGVGCGEVVLSGGAKE